VKAYLMPVVALGRDYRQRPARLEVPGCRTRADVAVMVDDQQVGVLRANGTVEWDEGNSSLSQHGLAGEVAAAVRVDPQIALREVVVRGRLSHVAVETDMQDIVRQPLRSIPPSMAASRHLNPNPMPSGLHSGGVGAGSCLPSRRERH
jgi:hypothetical protein